MLDLMPTGSVHIVKLWISEFEKPKSNKPITTQEKCYSRCMTIIVHFQLQPENREIAARECEYTRDVHGTERE